MKASTSLQHASLFTRVLLLGSMLELLYILICMLLPFNITHPLYSAKDPIWLWIFAPAQSLVLKTSILNLRFTDPGTRFLLLSLIIISLSSIYLYIVGNTFHTSNNIPLTPRWLLAPIIGATTFGITLLFLPTLFNNDANDYLYRGLALFFHLANCLLIWVILAKLASARRLGGALLYAWNPLALIELAGYGYNDGLLIFFLLVTTLLIIQSKGYLYDFCGMVFLGCAMSMNGITLLFTPMMIYFSILRSTKQVANEAPIPDGKQRTTLPLTSRSEKGNYRHVVWECIWKTLVAVITASVLYFLLWQRISIFTSIFSPFDMQYLIHSPPSILVIPVQLFNSFLFRILYPPATFPANYLQAIPTANMAVQASAIFIFVLIYLYLFRRVHSADSLLTCLCLVMLGFLILLAGQFWPWYILWALWIIALRRFDTLTISVLLLSCTALLAYPLLYVNNVPIVIYQPLLIFGIPLIYLITRLIRSNERMNLFYDRRSETAKN
ncbi:MAG: hypothetical protein ACXWPG_05830 [Ktedonobacteraceae bacterium]